MLELQLVHDNDVLSLRPLWQGQLAGSELKVGAGQALEGSLHSLTIAYASNPRGTDKFPALSVGSLEAERSFECSDGSLFLICPVVLIRL